MIVILEGKCYIVSTILKDQFDWAHKCAQSFSRDPERSDAKLGKEITSQVPRIDTINGGIKALVV